MFKNLVKNGIHVQWWMMIIPFLWGSMVNTTIIPYTREGNQALQWKTLHLMIFPAINLHGYCSPLVRGPTFAVSAAPHCGHPQDPRFAEALPEGGDLPSGASVMLAAGKDSVIYRCYPVFSFYPNSQQPLKAKLWTSVNPGTVSLCKVLGCAFVRQG